MTRKLFYLSIPLVLGLVLAAVVMVAPAQAQDGPDHWDPPGSDASGVVESFPEGLTGNWTIGGVVYTATHDTRFRMMAGPFFVGACVHVRYDPADNTAYVIETLFHLKCGGDAQQTLYGLIDQVPEGYTPTVDLTHGSPGITGTWVISGVEFLSSLHTRLRTYNGPLAPGACARVRYTVVEGSNVASEISSEKLYRCFGPVAFNQAYGYVVTYPPDLYGTWLISDTAGMSLTFMTTPASHVFTRTFPLETGACIKTIYFSNEGVNYATFVRTLAAQHCEGRFIDQQPPSKIYATLDAIPTGTITGTWTLAGVDFNATDDTRFDDKQGPLEVGACVEGKYDATNSAMRLYKLESEEDEDCQDWGGAPRFRLYGVVELLPGGGYTGTWQVSGVSFQVNPSTTLEMRHGDLATGAYVKVYFTYDAASGERSAQLIKTHVAPGYGRIHMRGRFGGWVRGPSGDQIIINGAPIQADADIDAPEDLQNGDMVWVNLYHDQEGDFATQISLDQAIYLPMVQH